MDQTPLTRRAVVAGGCGLAAAAALTACSGYGASGPVTASAPSAAPNEAAGTAGGTAASPGAVAAVADVPVGGGIVLADQDLVVTQPVAGTFKGVQRDLHPPGMQGQGGGGRHDQLPVPRQQVRGRRRHADGRAGEEAAAGEGGGGGGQLGGPGVTGPRRLSTIYAIVTDDAVVCPGAGCGRGLGGGDLRASGRRPRPPDAHGRPAARDRHRGARRWLAAPGFVCEGYPTGPDISAYGGWRGYLAAERRLDMAP